MTVHGTWKKENYGENEIDFKVKLNGKKNRSWVFFVIEKDSLVTGKCMPVYKSECKENK